MAQLNHLLRKVKVDEFEYTQTYANGTIITLKYSPEYNCDFRHDNIIHNAELFIVTINGIPITEEFHKLSKTKYYNDGGIGRAEMDLICSAMEWSRSLSMEDIKALENKLRDQRNPFFQLYDSLNKKKH